MEPGKQRVIEIMKKVSFKLNSSETDTITKGIQMYLVISPVNSLDWKAQVLRTYQLYESKFRKTTFMNKKHFKFNLNMSEASTLNTVLNNIEARAGIYESVTINKVLEIINKQTI